MLDDPKTGGTTSGDDKKSGQTLGWVGAGLTALGIIIGVSSNSKARKEAEKQKKEDAEILASYSGNNAKTLGELKALRDMLVNEQRTNLQMLIQIIQAADKKRWKDEIAEYQLKLDTEDFETKIDNLIHTGFLGNARTSSVVTNSRKYSSKFDANAIKLRAINVTIDNKTEKGETDTSIAPLIGDEPKEKSWSTILSDFWTKGEIEENHLNILRVGLGLIALLLFVKFRKKRKKRK